MSAPSPLRDLPIEFVGSFPDPGVRLEPVLPEIALVGRSNVGKSSLLNALVGRRSLARVSATPGKTNLLNVFRLPPLYLVDLPGYGFARVGKSVRAAYKRLVYGYLERRATLAGVVWLLDVRHGPSAEDREIQELLVAQGRPVLPVFTKADKLSRRQQLERERELCAALGVAPDHVQLVSSHSGHGIAELGASILAAATPGAASLEESP
ncbi:MAG TPA: ribosome biogenesis GTP-binding protein YihA/YsxC [Gemmatimonadales bacterium]|nr:ribosome biogenesis GTP-binding protein YihA/YsxC [Gemmatimonadales bacterium]